MLKQLKRLQELLWEDDDMMDQENLFEAQEIIDGIIGKIEEEHAKNKKVEI